jgi:hypothetical protein
MGAPNGVPVFFLISARGVFGDPALAVPIVERVGRHCRCSAITIISGISRAGGLRRVAAFDWQPPKQLGSLSSGVLIRCPMAAKAESPSLFSSALAPALFSPAKPAVISAPGAVDRKENHQIWCGPSMGAFNEKGVAFFRSLTWHCDIAPGENGLHTSF